MRNVRLNTVAAATLYPHTTTTIGHGATMRYLSTGWRCLEPQQSGHNRRPIPSRARRGRVDYATVAAIGALFGVFSFVAAANEVMVGAVSPTGWRILRGLLAVLFVVVGFFAFFRPEDTFVGLAAVMSFYFIFRGSFDIAMALAGSRAPGWWLLVVVGLAELAIGFWAAGSWKASVVVLVSWVGAGRYCTALARPPRRSSSAGLATMSQHTSADTARPGGAERRPRLVPRRLVRGNAAHHPAVIEEAVRRQIHLLTTELHRRLIAGSASGDGAFAAAT